MSQILRGDVWLADLNPVVGTEQAGVRPVLIVSRDILNATGSADVFAVPITSTPKQLRSRIPIGPPEGGLDRPSFIMCDKLRSISRLRLKKRLDSVKADTLATVTEVLAWIIGVEI